MCMWRDGDGRGGSSDRAEEGKYWRPGEGGKVDGCVGWLMLVLKRYAVGRRSGRRGNYRVWLMLFRCFGFLVNCGTGEGDMDIIIPQGRVHVSSVCTGECVCAAVSGSSVLVLDWRLT